MYGVSPNRFELVTKQLLLRVENCRKFQVVIH